jgi:hypothetical protein
LSESLKVRGCVQELSADWTNIIGRMLRKEAVMMWANCFDSGCVPVLELLSRAQRDIKLPRIWPVYLSATELSLD